MNVSHGRDRSFLPALIGDGRPLLAVLAFGLLLSGLFALFLAGTGHFLPHDEQFLGMTAKDLCALHGCRIVHFMIHDRASFGSALAAIGLFYLWLIEFPLRQRRPWAWWAILLSGTEGFASFFAYLGYGYLDSWHGIGTLLLVPFFVFGLYRTRRGLTASPGFSSLWRLAEWAPWSSRLGVGRACLLGTACGLMGAGLTILLVGMTCVFVPQDLGYMGLSIDDLHALNPRLVPLIAHDRAGFGGAVCCTGILMFCGVGWGKPCRSLWQVLALCGALGFSTAIGVHPAVGYNDAVHLTPAVSGAVLFALGLMLTYGPLMGRNAQNLKTGSPMHIRPRRKYQHAGTRGKLTPPGTPG